MANIVIIGAGVMGSALAVPASATNNVSLIGTFLDDDIVRSVQQSRHHPTLDVDLPESISVCFDSDDNAQAYKQADVIVLGVSSPGVEWALNEINRHECQPNIVALVTKGLVEGDSVGAVPQTYAEHLPGNLTVPQGRIVGIGGPCIARELALNYPTRVAFASHNVSVAYELRDMMQTATYRITTSSDITGLEACAALKNFMCIGVSAMFSAYELEDSHAKNPLAALFNQAVLELAILSNWINENAALNTGKPAGRQSSSSHQTSAFDLAGMGDLHVTVGGGRNSRLGRYLGTGVPLQQIVNTTMKGVTVEGVDTGRVLATGFYNACDAGHLEAQALPLTTAILNAILHDSVFDFDFTSLPD